MQRDFSRWADSKTDCIEISCLSHLLTKRDQRRINTESKLMRHAFRVYSLQDQSSASFCLQLISSWLFCSLLQSCDCSDFPVKDLDYFLLFLPWVSPSVVITVTWLVLLCSVSVHYRSWNIPVVFFWITKVLFSRVTDCFSGSFFFFCKNSFLSLSFDDENSFLSSHRFFVAGGCDSDDFLVYLRDCLSLEKRSSLMAGDLILPNKSKKAIEEDRGSEESRPEERQGWTIIHSNSLVLFLLSLFSSRWWWWWKWGLPSRLLSHLDWYFSLFGLFYLQREKEKPLSVDVNVSSSSKTERETLGAFFACEKFTCKRETPGSCFEGDHYNAMRIPFKLLQMRQHPCHFDGDTDEESVSGLLFLCAFVSIAFLQFLLFVDDFNCLAIDCLSFFF